MTLNELETTGILRNLDIGTLYTQKRMEKDGKGPIFSKSSLSAVEIWKV